MKPSSPPRSILFRILRILLVFGLFFLSYFIWEPGAVVTDGRHDRGTNGMWIAHGWLGGDDWFQTYVKDVAAYRSENALRVLVSRCEKNHITDLFPHLCPCGSDGSLPSVNREQVERFLEALGPKVRVFPWVGGPGPDEAHYPDAEWRKRFCESVKKLLEAHPRLAGVQINIEPMPTGSADFLELLEELHDTLPKGKLLSIAAYPPPTRWHPHTDVHWDESYFREVAKRADHLAVMMYDTALRQPKIYRKLMADWTEEVLHWAGEKPVLLGIPTYSDAGVNYHDPSTENLTNALSGIHAGLKRFKSLPENYAGVAIYCDWETDESEWQVLKENFLKP